MNNVWRYLQDAGGQQTEASYPLRRQASHNICIRIANYTARRNLHTLRPYFSEIMTSYIVSLAFFSGRSWGLRFQQEQGGRQSSPLCADPCRPQRRQRYQGSAEHLRPCLRRH